MLKRAFPVSVGCLLTLGVVSPAHAGIVFNDVTVDVGVDFVRARSATFPVIEALREASLG